MGFLDNLWDETLAGPAPDSGHGSPRKLASSPPPLHLDSDVFVTRSITIVRTVPSSVLLPSTAEPLSPGTPSDFKKLTRRKQAVEPSQRAEPRSPTVYDWIVISALDR